MAFDTAAAKKAGYTDAEIAAHLAQGSKFDLVAAKKAGYSDADVIAHLQPAQETKAAPAGGAPAFLSGLNRSIVSRLGVLPFNPVDTAANVIDLGKAAIGAPYIAATDKAPPSWLEVGNRAEVVGSGPWLVAQARKTGIGRKVLDPTDQTEEGGYTQAAGAGAGMGSTPGSAANAALSALLGKYVSEKTGSNALAVAASMSPTAASQGVKAGARAVATPSDQRAAELARAAVNRHGIPLSAADTTDSRFAKAARSVMNDTPLLSSLGAAQDAGKTPAFNRAVGQTFGADAPALTPRVMAGAAQTMGGKFDALYGRNTLTVDGQLFGALQAAKQSARELPEGGRQRVLKWVDDIEGQMVPGPGGAPTIPGNVVNAYQSKLRTQVETAAKSDGFLADALGGIRGELLGAFNRSVSSKDASALSDVKGQWKAFKTVAPLLAKSDAGVAGRLSGDVPPGLLPMAVAKNYGNASGTPIGELAQIGSQFLTPRVLQTGGSPKAMIQNSVVGGGLLTALGLANPVAAAGGAGMAALIQAAIGSPKLARELLNSGLLKPAEVQALTNVPGLLDNN